MQQTDHYVRFERVTSVAETPNGLLADLHGEHLRLDVVRDDIVRVKISRGGVFDEEPTFVVCVDPLSDPPAGQLSDPPAGQLSDPPAAQLADPPADAPPADAAQFAVARTAERITLSTARLVVSLWLDPFRLDVHRTDGTPVVETAADAEGRYWAYATLNDAFTVRRRCRHEDAIYGLGEKSGRHNRRGRDFTMWNTDVLSPSETLEFTAGKPPGDPRGDRTSVGFDPFYVSIPFFYHQTYPAGGMAGSFLDNGYRTSFEFSAPTEYRINAAGGQYTEYIFAGPDMPDILAGYTWLTGRAEPPPIWALGYHQCRWFDYTQDAVEAIGARHRDHGVPLDGLWLDIEYMDGYRVFTWNTDRFPDAAGMLARLADQGIRVITIIDPGVKFEPGYPVFDQGRERDVFCRTEGGDTYIGQVWPGNTALPDFVTEDARAWWGELNAAHVRSGLAGIWNDMNEPATGTIPALPMRFGKGRHPHERYRNQYALLMAMGTRAGLQESMPDRRTFILSRAGFAGIQRYAANWMGDNLSRWDHLWLSIGMGAGLGISGQPFVGADVGGFMGEPDAELFTRWMQYGTLTPFCRNHTAISSIDQYAWAFGSVVEGLVRDAVRLRYRLLPYIYSAFIRACETGEPVQRPMVLDHQYDGAVRDLDDQYLFGPDLLVAPVTEAGMTARQVYLPAGDWHDWHTGELLAGSRFVIAATPMDRIPIYARAGAVIPMWPDAPPSTSGYFPEAIELHLFVARSDGTRTGRLVEDDGLTFASREGGYLGTTFTVTRADSRVDVVVEVDGHGFAEFRREAFRLVVHGASPSVLRIGGGEVPLVEGAFTIPNRGTAFTAEFDV
jgi:alpha-glucosidase